MRLWLLLGRRGGLYLRGGEAWIMMYIIAFEGGFLFMETEDMLASAKIASHTSPQALERVAGQVQIKLLSQGGRIRWEI